MRVKTGTILNLGRVSRYMKSRDYLGLVWDSTAYDSRRSSDRRMSVILLRGHPKRSYQFGIDWYWRTVYGYENERGHVVPFLFTRSTSDIGLFWSPDLCGRYFGFLRKTLSDYVPKFSVGLSRVRVLPNRQPDERGLARVLPREIKSTGKLAMDHRVDALFFNSKDELNQYLRCNIRMFSRVKGVVRTNEGNVRLNHWNIGPIRP